MYPGFERIAVLAPAVKPGTDDVGNARSIPVTEGLRVRNADIAPFDPVATEAMGEHFLALATTDGPEAVLDDAVAALIVTEWDEIANLDDAFDRMATPVAIDGRHAIDRRDGLVYEGLTW